MPLPSNLRTSVSDKKLVVQCLYGQRLAKAGSLLAINGVGKPMTIISSSTKRSLLAASENGKEFVSKAGMSGTIDA